MKKIQLALITFTLIAFTSCKNDNKEANTKKENNIETKKETPSYLVQPDKTTVQWTAYKTTDKKPVSGVFNTIDFNKKTGGTPKEALNGIKFSIPVSSIFSKNEERDGKLKVSFFGAMIDTAFLKGTISFDENDNCNIAITMNGETHSLPFEFSINKNTVSFKGSMNLEDWDALGAITSLNKVCFDQHKGEDGISKTWNDVTIEVETILEVL